MADYWTPAFDLLLEEARRSIDRQSERLEQARQRATALVGFGAVVAAALGLGSDDLGYTGLLGAAAFAVVAACALWVLHPRRFEFELGARKMDAWFDDPDNAGLNHMLHSTALAHDDHHRANYRKLELMQRAISMAVWALVVETVALMANLVL